jgi:hypothetical protein
MRLALLIPVLSLAVVVTSTAAHAVPTSGDSVPPVRAVRLTSPVSIDGVLDDAVWQGPPAVTRLTQSEPTEGVAPSESTWAWVAYDDDALYVAARCWDSQPDSIIARLVRRDTDAMTDWCEIWLDPFHDHRSGYYFTVSAAGVLYDGVGFNDGMWDNSWDGVWSARARRDDRGWTLEMRIPFSQLRFRPGPEQVWGVNFHRYLARRHEDDYLVYKPRTESGVISRLPHLVGIEMRRHPRSLEVTPYTTGKAEYLARDPGDPFNDGSRYTPGLGGDLRTNVGNKLTLNATANPDFGQVEVDPAVVNLSDVESYFDEKRPFFTENARIFGFGNEGANDYWGFNWPEPRFFYTRRVGRAPQGGVPPGSEFRDVPVAAHILGAAKLTGKLSPSVNFGMLHAVTSREDAKYQLDGLHSKLPVEPLTYYGVVRGQKELKGGYNGLGAMTTLVQRRFDRSGLGDVLNRQSLMAGLDGWHFLDAKKVWVLSGWAVMSRVAGTEARMIGLQQDPRHYLQRPDAKHLGVDRDARSLTGYGARLWLNKQQGSVLSNSAIGFMTPSFDVNDIGYQMWVDVINAHVGGGYRWTNPGRWRRYAHVIGGLFQSRDFDGNITSEGVYGVSRVLFTNNLVLTPQGGVYPRTVNTRRTRGGPLTLNHPAYEFALSVETDTKAKLSYYVNAYASGVPETRSFERNVEPGLEWKPVSNLSLRIGPSLARAVEDAQYVTTSQVPDPGNVPADFGGLHYIFARLEQTTVGAVIRFNVSLTPDLSLQTYLQPLISAGRYTDFKELARSRSYEFLHHSTYDPATNMVDPDGPGPAPATPNDNWNFPQFNFKSLRGNAVLRWEYRPGSVLYLVWTQERADWEGMGDLRFGTSVRRLLDAKANNILLAKATYYFNL